MTKVATSNGAHKKFIRSFDSRKSFKTTRWRTQRRKQDRFQTAHREPSRKWELDITSERNCLVGGGDLVLSVLKF